MSGQKWNFAGIQGGKDEIIGAVSSTEELLNQGEQSLAKLAEAWGGSGSEAYQDIQRRWHENSNELNGALKTLATKIGEAGDSMHATEKGVTGMFT